MRTPEAATQDARGIDARVADSPLVGLRYHVDAWAADLEVQVEQVQQRIATIAASRSTLIQALRDNEDMRRHVLRALHRYAAPDVVRCFHEGLALGAELARLDEEAAGFKRRLEAAASQRDTFRSIAATLRRLAASGTVAVNERSSRMSQASRQIFQIGDEEHEEMTRAILDGPMQRLTDAAFEAELAGQLVAGDSDAAVKHASRCRVATADAARRLDEIITRLRPVTGQRSLVHALRELLAACPARVHVIGRERRLQAMQELTVFRIVEEAVDNAMRHGHSSRIDVILSFHHERVVLVIKDDGEGFDVPATEARLGRTRALGLIEMHERAALAGSRLEVRSLIGAGTEVRVMLAQRR